MKKLILLPALMMLFASCYNRMGSLTVVSTRNIEAEGKYVLLIRNVEATSKAKRGEALQQAIDKAIKKAPGADGELLKNVVIFQKRNGKKIRVTGDVWGTKKQ